MDWISKTKKRAKKLQGKAKSKAPRLTKKLLKKMTTPQLKRLEDMVVDELVDRNAMEG